MGHSSMGGFGGLVKLAGRRRALWPAPDAGLRRRLDDVLGMPPLGEHPTDVRRERSWTADGLAGEELSWSVGFGPRTHAWIIKPEMFWEADQLFPLVGMRRAEARLRERYAAAGRPEAYTGRFHAGGHAFDRAMQDEAFSWLARTLC